MQKYIFLVSGKARHGKDSIYLEGKDIFNWERAAFADKLKEILMDLYGLSKEQVYGDKKEEPDFRYPNKLDPDIVEVEDKALYREIKLPKGVRVNKAVILQENTTKDKYLTPRKIAIEVGKSQRSIYEEVWADYTFRNTIPGLLAKVDNVIVTDVRFPNEITVAENYIPIYRQLGFEVILIKLRVIRPSITNIKDSNDISEVALDTYKPWNFVVNNNGTLEDLKNKIRRLKVVLTSTGTPINAAL